LLDKLEGILSPVEVKKYQNYFASLIFMELEAEKEGGGQGGLVSAMATFKNIDTTAKFGRLN